MLNDDFAFRIIDPEGHEYAIYRNGTVTGFPEGSIIDNRIPAIEQAVFLAGIKFGKKGRSGLPRGNSRSSAANGSHQGR